MENNIIRPYIRKTTACLTTLAACLLLSVASTSCSDYLNEQPKGMNIPSKLSDFSEMLNYEYGAHRYDITQAANPVLSERLLPSLPGKLSVGHEHQP